MTTPAATTPALTTPAALALSYAAHQIHVFPCREADELTGDFDPETGEQIVFKAKTPKTSNGFIGASINTRVVGEFWKRNPAAMVAIPTGEKIGAWVLDVDVHEDETGQVVDGYATLAALTKQHGALPETAHAKTAGGGTHYYFSHVSGVRNRGALGAGLDVRGSGGYVVAPGSVTADGRRYAWIDFDGEGLPPIAPAPDWLLALVLPKPEPAPAAVPLLSSTGNTAYVDRAVDAELSELAATGKGGRNNALNDSAYSLGQFVGAGALAESSAREMLESVAKNWSNFPLSKATIKRGLDAGRQSPRVIPEPTISHDDGTALVDFSGMLKPKAAETLPTIEELDDAPEYRLEAIADLESLTYPGGLISDLVDWITASAEQPNRVLALAAVLPLIGALAGARYATGTRDTRPNIYSVALAESGFGKEHARSQIKRLLMADKDVLAKYSGPARIMSASALREVLEHHPYVNCQIDEFGGFVRDITDRNAGGHQKAISTDLRDYYSASSTFFEGAAYRGSPPKRIYNPTLCIHGTSTPDQFWNALSSSSAEDGLLPRLILFIVGGEEPEPVKPEIGVRDMPYQLMQQMTAVAGIDVGKARLGGFPSIGGEPGKVETVARVVPWTRDALVMFESIKRSVKAQEKLHPSEHKPFVRRIIENAIKLALIVAIGTDPHDPVITEATIEWAAALSWTCAAAMLEQVAERLADNLREANHKRISGLIKGAGKNGITVGRLGDRVKQIDARQREEIIKDLIDAGRVDELASKTRGRPSRRLTWSGAK